MKNLLCGLLVGGVLFAASVGTAQAPARRPRPPEQIIVEKFRKEAKTSGNVSVGEGVKWIRDIAYRKGTSDKYKLDVVFPEKRAERPRPGLVVVHGGGLTVLFGKSSASGRDGAFTSEWDRRIVFGE